MTVSTPTTGARALPVPPARLHVRGLSKTFGSTRVLHDIAFDVRPGEIHALVGQNGSGKSTIAKILSGLHPPDPGSVVAIDGHPFRLPVRPDESRERGMAVVHQSLGLLPGFSVLENMRIGRLQPRGVLRWIDWKTERAAADAVFDRIGRSVDLDAPVASLHEEDRATVAIARALQDADAGSGLIMFDESTRALSRRALEHFFTLLHEIVATGTAVLMITHRLEEVLDAADRVTVLRDGRAVVSGAPVAGMDEAELTRIILGRTVDTGALRHTPDLDEDDTARVTGLTGRLVQALDLTIRRGEVVGLTGIAGSGYDEVPGILSGATPGRAGTLELAGRTKELRRLTPGSAIAAGVGLLPEGREAAGLAMGLTVSENISFPHTARRRASLLPRTGSEERTRAGEWIERLDVRPPRAESAVNTLSGGNQQKVLLGKWLSMDPELLVLHEPTQAVDVGARRIIVDAIHAAAEAGTRVVVASADENELALLCDRVLVFEDGSVVRELVGPLTPDDIVEGIYAGTGRGGLGKRDDGTAPAVS